MNFLKFKKTETIRILDGPVSFRHEVSLDKLRTGKEFGCNIESLLPKSDKVLTSGLDMNTYNTYNVLVSKYIAKMMSLKVMDIRTYVLCV